MFKKRTRPASVREKPAAAEEPKAEGEDGDEVEEAGDAESGLDMEELRLLRKLKKSKQGIDLEKLNRGEVKKNSKKKDQDEIQGYGLQGSSRKDDGGDDDLQGEEGRVKKLVRSNNFTQQTNALDVDKHMLAYIEGEMEKRRGMSAPEATKPEPFDPQAELYKISDKYNVQARKIKEAEEGNVTNSLGMLTSIPEVDLGMDNRLRNIEETERAKREMMEERKAASEAKGPREEDYSAARFYRPNQRVASDIYAIEDARRAAAGGGIPAEPRPPRQDRVDRHESATDEQVYDRFKKRMKR